MKPVTRKSRPLIAEKWHLRQYDAKDRKRRPRFVLITDCTLREGEQAPGVVMSPTEKLKLARELDAAGFRELEVGMPSISDEEAETVESICRAGLEAHGRLVPGNPKRH